MADSKLPLKNQVRRLKLYALSLINDLYSGGYRSVAKGQGLEFQETRPYLISDEVRFIDWNVTARLGETYVKTFSEEKELRLQLLVDNSLSLYSGSSDVSKKDLADFLVVVFSYIAQMNNDPVGVLFFDSQMLSLPARKNLKHVNQIIQRTLSRKLGKGSDLAKALRTTLEESKRRSMVVIISDFKTADYFKDLAILSKYHDIIAIRLEDDSDEEFPDVGFVSLEDPETGEVIQVSGKNQKFKENYRDNFILQRIRWKRECLKRKISILEINTKDDYFRKVKFFLKNKRKKK